jgi:hypothetical protein
VSRKSGNPGHLLLRLLGLGARLGVVGSFSGALVRDLFRRTSLLESGLRNVIITIFVEFDQFSDKKVIFLEAYGIWVRSCRNYFWQL